MAFSKENTHFYSDGNRIAAHVYRPEGIPGKLPAVLIAAPQASVKEQAVANYGERMAKLGYVALTFDHASFGDSEGQPRFNENPFNKAEDFRNGVTFLRSLDYVDGDKIHGLGVCSGSGYLAHAVASDRRIKSLATVSAYFDHRGFYHTIMGRDGILKLLDQVNEARETYLKTGHIEYLPHVPDQIDPDAPVLFQQAYDYYQTPRGVKGRYESKFLPWSYNSLVNFSALDIADKLAPTPLLMIVGTEAASRNESEQMFEAANEPKEFLRFEGAGHFEFYDVPEYVDRAVEKISAFYERV